VANESEPFSWTVPPSGTVIGSPITAMGSSFRINRPFVMSIGNAPNIVSPATVPTSNRPNGFPGSFTFRFLASRMIVASRPSASTVAPGLVTTPPLYNWGNSSGAYGLASAKIVPVNTSTLVKSGPLTMIS